MEVVQVNDTFIPGRGIDRVVYEICKRMEVDLTIISSRIEYDLPGAELVELPVRNTLHPVLWMIRQVKDYAKSHPSCIFHYHHMILNWALASPRTLCTFHGWSPESLDRSPLIRRKLRQKFLEFTARKYRDAPRVTAVNSYQLPFLERMGVKNPLHVPNGVDTEKFSASKKDDGYMLFVGRLTDQKRPDELIRLSSDINFPLHMVGSGPLEPKLRQLVSKLNAPVSILGRVEEGQLLNEYQHCSFFVSASRWEGMTLTVPEAYACAKPILVYNIPAMSEFPIGAKCSNYGELACQADILAKDESYRNELGEKARAYAEANLSWDGIVEKYLSIYRELQ